MVTYDFTLHLRIRNHTAWFRRCVGMAFRQFLLGSHNFMVTTLGSCVKWPLVSSSILCWPVEVGVCVKSSIYIYIIYLFIIIILNFFWGEHNIENSIAKRIPNTTNLAETSQPKWKSRNNAHMRPWGWVLGYDVSRPVAGVVAEVHFISATTLFTWLVFIYLFRVIFHGFLYNVR